MKIALQTAGSMVFGLLFFGATLFWPAGTFHYWQAWLFLAVFFVMATGPSLYLATKRPDVLRRRLKAGPQAETRPVQRVAITGTVATVAAVLVVSALDHRFGWSTVPTPVVIVGAVLVAVGLGTSQLVILQNSYAAATVTVEAGQRVVTSGLYGLVRHPMYSSTAVMMLGTPPALGSWWGLVALLPGIVVMRMRILDEERLLRDELDGYAAYTRQVRYRLLPYVW
ncbi:isoprenylcysteine carboxylmethyltransferase family protein [Mycobacterium sp. GA-2829]|uniref:methyltransferase family protein n=1 Tax=Mycobacterium sp. GA-2829 TaxID=1772283 RepID=UPI00073FB3FD|nr:isoprenylcysteine carboxylmethyltransferase family protein [Mycobacterium sp. GA-2829]KUI30745.1 hypothetical protein AU194_15715 [Mycobacterium sp. GA-2829]